MRKNKPSTPITHATVQNIFLSSINIFFLKNKIGKIFVFFINQLGEKREKMARWVEYEGSRWLETNSCHFPLELSSRLVSPCEKRPIEVSCALCPILAMKLSFTSYIYLVLFFRIYGAVLSSVVPLVVSRLISLSLLCFKFIRCFRKSRVQTIHYRKEEEILPLHTLRIGVIFLLVTTHYSIFLCAWQHR